MKPSLSLIFRLNILVSLTTKCDSQAFSNSNRDSLTAVKSIDHQLFTRIENKRFKTVVSFDKDQTTVFLGTSYHSGINTNFIDDTVKPKCSKKCSKVDRHKNKWEECTGHKIWKQCATLIPGSSGIADWLCINQKFSTLQPNVKDCKSRWLQEMKEKLNNVRNMVKNLL